MQIRNKMYGAIAAAAVVSMGSAVAVADSPDGVFPATEINVIGNVSVTTQFRDIQKPYWTEVIPKLTGGKLKVNFKAWNHPSIAASSGVLHARWVEQEQAVER